MFAGMAAGLAMGAWAAARRGDTALDRFIAYSEPPSMIVFTCPADLETDAPEDDQLAECMAYAQGHELEVIRSVPGVEGAARTTVMVARVTPEGHPEHASRRLVLLSVDSSTPRVATRPIVLAGREVRPDSASEVVVNEPFRRSTGLGVGDRVSVTPYLRTEPDAAADGQAPPSGVTRSYTIAGVVRYPVDLDARLTGSSIYEDRGFVVAGPGFWQQVGNDFFRYGFGTEVRLAPGTDPEAVIAEYRTRVPGQQVFVDTNDVFGLDPSTIERPISYESAAARVFAVFVVVAALVFVGQAIARQVRREWVEAPTLRVLGMSRSAMRLGALWRAAPLALGAGAIAALTCVALSAFGPVGLAADAEVDPGVSVDVPVLVVGVTLTILVTGAVAMIAAPAWPWSTTRDTAARPVRSWSTLSPPGVAGLAMSSRSAASLAFGTAVAGTALAVAGAVAAGSLVASVRRLGDEPRRYGASWDATVGNVADERQLEETRAQVLALPEMERAGGIYSGFGELDGVPVPIVAVDSYTPAPRRLDPVVVRGRVPTEDGEVALGPLTWERLGAHLGDVVHVTMNAGSDQPSALDLVVVGEALLSDGISVQPGKGLLLTASQFHSVDEATAPQVIAVTARAGPGHAADLEKIHREFPATFVMARPPADVRNLQRLDAVPVLLAAVVATFAFAALAHMLVLSVRRQRRQLAVLKALGFSRGQVSRAVAWHASSLVAVALAVGLPLGVMGGRVLWTSVVDRLGVVAPPIVPLGVSVVVAVLTLFAANVVAAWPAWRAARIPPAQALRTE
jgi:hypothetical protein